MIEDVSHVGTRDFFYDAADALQNSDTPHVILCGFDGSRFRYSSVNISSKVGLRWFKDGLNKLLDEMEPNLPEKDE